MDLYDYFHKEKKKKKTTLAQFARQIGLTYHHVSRIMRGLEPPSFSTCLTIEKYTNSEVTLMEMMNFAYDHLKEKQKKNSDVLVLRRKSISKEEAEKILPNHSGNKGKIHKKEDDIMYTKCNCGEYKHINNDVYHIRKCFENSVPVKKNLLPTNVKKA